MYGLDEGGQVREWQWDDSGKWTGPSYIGAVAQVGTTVTAANDGQRVSIACTSSDL